MKNSLLVYLLFCIVNFSCNNDSNGLETDYQASLSGTWQLNERGFSPGSGYVIEPVSPSPAQAVAFVSPKTFISNLTGFSQYKFYEIITDGDGISTLQLSVEDPELGATNATIKTKYTLELEGGNLKIIPRNCIEGCHLGFRKSSEEVQSFPN